jgi:hypothetical protein
VVSLDQVKAETSRLTERAALSREVLELDGEPYTFAILAGNSSDGTLDVALDGSVGEERLIRQDSLVDDTSRVVGRRRGVGDDPGDECRGTEY